MSPCNINAYPIPEVMRIKDMIIQSEFSFMGVKGLKKMYYSACEKYKGRKKSEPLKAVEPVTLLRGIYTVRLGRMRQAYDRPTT